MRCQARIINTIAAIVAVVAAVVLPSVVADAVSLSVPTGTTTLTNTYDVGINPAADAVDPIARTLRGITRPDAGGRVPLADSGVISAPRAASGAENAAQGARLTEHLRLTERYGTGGVRELADGRIRYYGELRPAAKPGEMAGLRVTREWNPATDGYRTWMETLDHAGRVRQVHPYQPFSEFHYMFDEFGNYIGRR